MTRVRNTPTTSVTGFMAALLAAVPVVAAEPDVAPEHEDSGGDEKHHAHRHFPGIFVGATTVDSETDFTFGVE